MVLQNIESLLRTVKNKVPETDEYNELKNKASVITSKAAMRGQGKTGHAGKPSGTSLFYTATS
jgi:hypothetical protein